MNELPDTLPGIDIASGLPRVAGNKKLYLRLLLQVAADTPRIREELSAAVMAGDMGKVREAAHSLKGSSSNLSVTDVARAAEALEHAAKGGDFPAMLTSLDSLEQALDKFTSVMAPFQAA